MGPAETISMPETAQWPVQGEVTTPMNANGLAPAGHGWAAGVPTVPIDPHSHNSMGWVERNDVEYWPPDNLDAQVPVFDFPGSNVYLKPSLP